MTSQSHSGPIPTAAPNRKLAYIGVLLVAAILIERPAAYAQNNATPEDPVQLTLEVEGGSSQKLNAGYGWSLADTITPADHRLLLVNNAGGIRTSAPVWRARADEAGAVVIWNKQSETVYDISALGANDEFAILLRCDVTIARADGDGGDAGGGGGGDGVGPRRWTSLSDIDLDGDSLNEKAAPRHPSNSAEADRNEAIVNEDGETRLGLLLPLNDDHDDGDWSRRDSYPGWSESWDSDSEVVPLILRLNPYRSGYVWIPAGGDGKVNVYHESRHVSAEPERHLQTNTRKELEYAIELASGVSSGEQGDLTVAFVPDSMLNGVPETMGSEHSYISEDRIRWVAVGVDIDADSNNDGAIEDANRNTVGDDFFEAHAVTHLPEGVRDAYRFGAFVPKAASVSEPPEEQGMTEVRLRSTSMAGFQAQIAHFGLSPKVSLVYASGQTDIQIFVKDGGSGFVNITGTANGVLTEGDSVATIEGTTLWQRLLSDDVVLYVRGLESGEVRLAVELTLRDGAMEMHRDSIRLTVREQPAVQVEFVPTTLYWETIGAYTGEFSDEWGGQGPSELPNIPMNGYLPVVLSGDGPHATLNENGVPRAVRAALKVTVNEEAGAAPPHAREYVFRVSASPSRSALDVSLLHPTYDEPPGDHDGVRVYADEVRVVVPADSSVGWSNPSEIINNTVRVAAEGDAVSRSLEDRIALISTLVRYDDHYAGADESVDDDIVLASPQYAGNASVARYRFDYEVVEDVDNSPIGHVSDLVDEWSFDGHLLSHDTKINWDTYPVIKGGERSEGTKVRIDQERPQPPTGGTVRWSYDVAMNDIDGTALVGAGSDGIFESTAVVAVTAAGAAKVRYVMDGSWPGDPPGGGNSSDISTGDHSIALMSIDRVAGPSEEPMWFAGGVERIQDPGGDWDEDSDGNWFYFSYPGGSGVGVDKTYWSQVTGVSARIRTVTFPSGAFQLEETLVSSRPEFSRTGYATARAYAPSGTNPVAIELVGALVSEIPVPGATTASTLLSAFLFQDEADDRQAVANAVGNMGIAVLDNTYEVGQNGDLNRLLEGGFEAIATGEFDEADGIFVEASPGFWGPGTDTPDPKTIEQDVVYPNAIAFDVASGTPSISVGCVATATAEKSDANGYAYASLDWSQVSANPVPDPSSIVGNARRHEASYLYRVWPGYHLD